VLAVAQEHLTVDHGGGDAAGALHESAGAGRQVVGDLRHLGRDCVGIEDDQVGRETLAHQAAIGEAPERRRHQRQHSHRLLQREGLLVPHPVAEQVGLQRGVHDLRDVRAGVGEGDHRARVAHHLQHVLLHLIGHGMHEEALEVLLQRQIDHRLGRIDAALPRDLGDRAVRALHLVVHVDPLVGERPRLGAEGALVGRLAGALDQHPLGRGIAQALQLLGQR
jgi:hypothetical protein